MRMQISVSSPPTGFLPTRPSSWRKPPTSARTSRRKDMLAPTRFRTAEGRCGMPEWVQPTTQSNSAGNQRGLPSSQRGRIAPPTADHGRVGVGVGHAARASPAPRSRRRRGRRRSRRCSPRRRCCGRPRGPASRCWRRRRPPASGSRASARSSGAWSMTRIVSRAGSVWARTDSIASPSTPSRSSVKAEITTEIVGGAAAGLSWTPVRGADSGMRAGRRLQAHASRVGPGATVRSTRWTRGPSPGGRGCAVA